jgi:ribosomal protein S18 acetylase RimI-like enzyme
MAAQPQYLLVPIVVRPLLPADTAAGAGVLGRGMRDNPIHERAFGEDPGRRETALTRLFAGELASHVVKGMILGAFSDGALVGVCSMVPPGRCQLSRFEKLRMIPALVAAGGLGPALRTLSWAGAWAKHDLGEPHWHLGPVGVERPLQGKGVGGTLLRAFCAQMDDARATAYLETDKPQNVSIYEHFGFRTVAEDQVLGITNWFMVRHAHA